MAITAADIRFYYSGGATGSPASSIGGSPSSTEITGGTHNLFDLVSSSEASIGDTEYRMIYVGNTNVSSLTLQNAVIWISADTTGAPSDVEIGVAPAGTTHSILANENASPTAQGFTATATSEGTALSLGNIAANGYRAVWVKRIVPPGAAAATGTGVTFTVKGDTAA
jgi:hypothetical protein